MAAPPESTHGRIGPNAIIQTAAAITDRLGAAEAAAVLGGTGWTLDHLPTRMVDERDVAAVMGALMRRHPGAVGEALMWESGVRTADYLLRVRIPRPAQRLLGVLPRAVALRGLLAAITRHAWTFAGSALFDVERPAHLAAAFSLRGCPVCRDLLATAPACHYYAATFQRLVRAIIAPDAFVREVACQATGSDACRFEISW